MSLGNGADQRELPRAVFAGRRTLASGYRVASASARPAANPYGSHLCLFQRSMARSASGLSGVHREVAGHGAGVGGLRDTRVGAHDSRPDRPSAGDFAVREDQQGPDQARLPTSGRCVPCRARASSSGARSRARPGPGRRPAPCWTVSDRGSGGGCGRPCSR
jgi:hypothetical protein